MLESKVLDFNPLSFGLNVAEPWQEIAEKIKAVLVISFDTKFWNDYRGPPPSSHQDSGGRFRFELHENWKLSDYGFWVPSLIENDCYRFCPWGVLIDVKN